MGNGFSEEANAPEKAMVRPVFNTSTITQGKIRGTWKRDKQERQEALDAEMAAFRLRRNTAPTLAGRQEAAFQIRKRILNTAQRRNESRRAAYESMRLGIRSTRTRKTREFASNATRDSPLERLEFYLELPKQQGYYKNTNKLFAALTILSNLPNGCETQIRGKMRGKNSYYNVCNDIILNDDHNELSRAIAEIDRSTFMRKFSKLEKLYNKCTEKHTPFSSRVVSTVTDTTERVIERTVPEQTTPGITLFEWIGSFFGLGASKSTVPVAEQYASSAASAGQYASSVATASRPVNNLPSLLRLKQLFGDGGYEISSTIKRLSFDEKRRYLESFNNLGTKDPTPDIVISIRAKITELPTDEMKHEFMDRYEQIVSNSNMPERVVLYKELFTDLDNIIMRKYAGNSKSTSSKSKPPKYTSLSSSAAGVFPTLRNTSNSESSNDKSVTGGSRTRKHKRKPRHSK